MHIVIIDILSLQICVNGTLKVPDEIKTSIEGVLQIKYSERSDRRNYFNRSST